MIRHALEESGSRIPQELPSYSLRGHCARHKKLPMLRGIGLQRLSKNSKERGWKD